MYIKNIDKTNFEGKFVLRNNFSNKPKQCVKKVQSEIQNLIQKKDYNIYLAQDYSKNEMSMTTEYAFPLKPSQRVYITAKAQETFPITSKASKYIQAAKNVIEKHENGIKDIDQIIWEIDQKKYKKNKICDNIELFVFAPVFILANITEKALRSVNPKWAKKFEKLIDKII